MSSDRALPEAERHHRLMNVLASLLANAQFVESTFEGSSPDAPLLPDAPAATRGDALTAIRHVVEAAHTLTSLLKK